MRVFVDTSALYSLLDAKDKNHASGRDIWQNLLEENAKLVTSNYVIGETTALVQNRLGMDAVTDLHESILPLVQVEWVEQTSHQSGVSALLTAKRRQLSLVDCISFETCRKLGIKDVFAFDEHFGEQQFNLLAVE